MSWHHRLTLAFLRLVLRLFFRVEIRGLEHIQNLEGPLLIISNHVSLLDAPIINAFFPKRPVFVVNKGIADWWLTKLSRFMAGNKIYSVDQRNPLATKELIRYLSDHPDMIACIFPEGRLSPGGKIMKVYGGTGMIVDKVKAKVLTVHIDGAHMSSLQIIPKKYPTFLRPRIVATFHAPQSIQISDELKGRARRNALGKEIYRLMSESMYQSGDKDITLFSELLKAREAFGQDKVIVKDADSNKLTYDGLVLGSVVLGSKFAAITSPSEVVGIMLPNVTATVASFFGLHYAGRVPAMLNFTSGASNVIAGCKAAVISKIITSRRFIEKANLTPLCAKLEEQGLTLIYLEDVKASLSLFEKIKGKLKSRHISFKGWHSVSSPQDPAVVLFTSGSEGAPKGVALSHRNLMANRWQAASCLDFNPSDILLNALPMFHSFGLGVATLLPIFEGIPVVLYPSPLHYRMVPEMIYDSHATLALGTDTFLSHYAKFAHPFDFNEVRRIFAGGEKLRPETCRIWMEKYGIRIMEGYGATEAAPIIAINTGIANRLGTVGPLVTGIEAKCIEQEGIKEGKRLYIRGENIMLGYLTVDKPGVIHFPETPLGEDWYDTGDIVSFDDEGFLTLQGRAKRFAKIGGEMVSLGAAEELIKSAIPEGNHAVVARPDIRKGEKLVLVSDSKTLSQQAISEAAKQLGIPALFMPKEIYIIPKLPLLGTGKPDYPAIMRLLDVQSVSPI